MTSGLVVLAGSSRGKPPLCCVVGEARIVGLGEVSHGTREPFQLKHWLLEYLVAVKGLAALAFEGDCPESLGVDDYVMSGRGAAAQALAGFQYWMWTTKEVLDVVRWLRTWNADPRHARKVHFYGIDAQFPDRAAEARPTFARSTRTTRPRSRAGSPG